MAGSADTPLESSATGAGRDERLLRRVEAGDPRAFEALYRLYHPRLSRFIRNMIGRPHLVEEVLNDTMMVVWERAEAYNGRSKVSTWVFAIAYRKALRALQRHQDPVEDPKASDRPSLDAGPEEQLGGAQLRDALRKAMAALSAEHRAVLDLTYFHGMAYRDIADVMECPVDTVKTRMFYARRHLKAKLDGDLADWLWSAS